MNFSGIFARIVALIGGAALTVAPDAGRSA